MAAASTLAEYCNKAHPHAPAERRQKLVQAAASALRTSPRARFLHELRNRLLHDTDVPLRITVSVNPLRGEVMMPKAALQALGDRHPGALRFLEEAEDLIPVAPLVREHRSEAVRVVEHVIDTVWEGRHDVIRESQAIEDEMADLGRRMARLRPNAQRPEPG